MSFYVTNCVLSVFNKESDDYDDDDDDGISVGCIDLYRVC